MWMRLSLIFSRNDGHKGHTEIRTRAVWWSSGQWSVVSGQWHGDVYPRVRRSGRFNQSVSVESFRGLSGGPKCSQQAEGKVMEKCSDENARFYGLFAKTLFHRSRGFTRAVSSVRKCSIFSEKTRALKIDLQQRGKDGSERRSGLAQKRGASPRRYTLPFIPHLPTHLLINQLP